MKYIILLSGFCIMLNQSIHAQDTPTKKHIVFRTKVHEVGSGTLSGYLYAMDDSTLYISKTEFTKSFMHVNESYLQKFDYSMLEKVRVRRHNSIGRGAIFGSISGLVVGAIAGAAMGNDPPPKLGSLYGSTTAGEKALIFGAVGATLGVITGVIIGAVSHKTFKIGRNKEKFRKMKSEMGGWVIQR